MKYPQLSKLHDHGVAGDKFGKWKKKNNIPRNDPFMLNYSDKLYYIGAIHTNDPKSSTYKMIDKAFKKFDVDFVVIEGVSFELGISPKLTYQNENEVKHTIEMASKYKLPYCGVEPTDKIIYSELP